MLEADAALIGVGTWVRSKTVTDPYGEPAGGIVCDIEHQRTIDQETGEVRDCTVYRCRDCNDRDPLHHRVMTGDDIDPATAWPASTYDIARLVRRVCFELGRSKSRSGIARELRPHERTALLDAIAVLAAVS